MKTTTNIIYVAFALVCFALAPQARATCQDGCLTNNKTAQGDDALFNNTGSNNNAAAELSRSVPAQALGRWKVTGDLNIPRGGHTATLLQNGQVLVAGGDATGVTAELYDPATGMWTTIGSMSTARTYKTATLLQNGKVLVAGGQNDRGQLATAELYDPATGVWTATGDLITPRSDYPAVLLPNGQVLVSGGIHPHGFHGFDAAEQYNPATGIWTATDTLKPGRFAHTATLLDNGQVLVAGGAARTGTLTRSQLYISAP